MVGRAVPRSGMLAPRCLDPSLPARDIGPASTNRCWLSGLTPQPTLRVKRPQVAGCRRRENLEILAEHRLGLGVLAWQAVGEGPGAAVGRGGGLGHVGVRVSLDMSPTWREITAHSLSLGDGRQRGLRADDRKAPRRGRHRGRATGYPVARRGLGADRSPADSIRSMHQRPVARLDPPRLSSIDVQGQPRPSHHLHTQATASFAVRAVIRRDAAMPSPDSAPAVLSSPGSTPAPRPGASIPTAAAGSSLRKAVSAPMADR